MVVQEEPELLARAACRRVYDAIEREPGLSVSALARRLGMYWTSVALQVGHLARAGLVRSVRSGRRRVLFTAHALDSMADARGLILLAEPACLRVARAIAAVPDQRIYELVERIPMSERALYHHVKRLVEAELVLSSKQGGYRGLRASPRLIAWLAMADPREGPDGVPDEAGR